MPADKALQNSLNAPFVHLLREYGQQRFHGLLKQLPLKGIVFEAEHYGLSLIVGGGEASLYDITNRSTTSPMPMPRWVANWRFM